MNKIAIVTGSTKGIGKAISEKLLEQGCFVFLNYATDDTTAETLVKDLEKRYKNNFAIIKADLSTYAGLDRMAFEVLSFKKSIDYLILNTGITERISFGELTPEIWNKVMNTNLNIPFFTVQKFAPNLSDYGRILFIGSLLGQAPHSLSIPYGVSKGGINSLVKYLVKEFCDRNITCNAILPGFVDTDWQKGKNPELRSSIEEKIALKRFAKPEEIAELCYNVIKNDYINGSLINIDGGYSYR